MNVASLELSKELYQLSGWIDTDQRWYDDDGWFTTTEKLNGMWVPAYDLGYLLRKLPEYVDGGCLEMNHQDGMWGFRYWDWGVPYRQTFDKIGFGDTPEDGACMLAIELFKQGVLNKEVNS